MDLWTETTPDLKGALFPPGCTSTAYRTCRARLARGKALFFHAILSAAAVLRFALALPDCQYRTGGVAYNFFRHTPQEDV